MTTDNLNTDLEEKLSLIFEELNINTPFDEILPIYQQICTLIDFNVSDNIKDEIYKCSCPSIYSLTLMYMFLPKNNRNQIIDEISNYVIKEKLHKESYNILKDNEKINNILISFNLDNQVFYNFNDKQLIKLRDYFDECLYDLSLFNVIF